MKKNNKIQDSPEFQHYKADFKNFVKEMEDDKASADLKIPDEWEQDFARTIDETLDENVRKRRTRIVKRIVGVAAAVVLVFAVGNLTAVNVSGEGLLEMFINRYFVGDKQHDIYGNENEVEFEEDNNQYLLYFDGTTLDKVSEQIRKELKCPMFYLEYLPDGFTVEEASYESVFRIINIKLVRGTEYIYIFQQRQVDERASGIISENSVNMTIQNNYLNRKITIYEGNQDNNWIFEFDDNGIVFSIDTLISKEECIKIAENIDYY